MADTNKFKERLKELRKEYSLTQQELADKIGVVRTAIANYETGRTIPDADTLSLLAKIFNTTTDYLLGNSDIRNPYKKTSINKIIKSNDVIEKEYKKEIEFLEKFRQEMISRGYDYYKDKTLEELADIVVKHLKIQEILDDNNSKSN